MIKLSRLISRFRVNRSFFRNIPISIILPEILSIILFISSIFLLIIPSLEDALMANQRQLIHNLTEVAWSTLHLYEEQEEAGILTRKQAQKLAMEHIRRIRYGSELKDYFWINDMQPKIIMHPYRTDLESHDVTNFTDPTGKHLFVEFVDTVKRKGSGFVDYQWQWMDNPKLIVPKISFVKGFAPWGWIVGTGIYVDDVKREITRLTHKITTVLVVIILILFTLSFFIIFQGIQFERDKKRAEQQAKMQNEHLNQAAKMASIGTLVSGVAHEINNPATSILLNAPLLKKIWSGFRPIVENHSQTNKDFEINGMNFESINERVPFLLDHIQDGAQRIKEIVAELKNYARANPSEMNDDVSINRSVRKAVGLVTNVIQKKTDHFAFDYRTDLPLFKGNAKKIEQVIINLLLNACQAIEKSSEQISISTNLDEKTGNIVVEVKDSGIGIPYEILDRIKDPFFTTKENNGNTGLGLAISDRIVKDHGGKLQFTSFPGKGTSAKIFFPVNPS